MVIDGMVNNYSDINIVNLYVSKCDIFGLLERQDVLI